MFNNVTVFLNIVKHTIVNVKLGGLLMDVTLEIRVKNTTFLFTFNERTIDSAWRFKTH